MAPEPKKLLATTALRSYWIVGITRVACGARGCFCSNGSSQFGSPWEYVQQVIFGGAMHACVTSYGEA